MEDLSDSEQLILFQRIVTGVTFPEGVGVSPSGESLLGTPSSSLSGKRAGPGAEKIRTRKDTATAATIWPRPLPPKLVTNWFSVFPPKTTIIVSVRTMSCEVEFEV